MKDKWNGKGKPGRKKLSGTRVNRRREILDRWKTAREAGLSRKKFCENEGITEEDVEKYQQFFIKRERRKQ